MTPTELDTLLARIDQLTAWTAQLARRADLLLASPAPSDHLPGRRGQSDDPHETGQRA